MLRSPRIPLLAAAVSAVGLAVTGVLAYLVPVAHVKDAVSLEAFRAINRGRLTPLLDHVAHLADPAPYAVIGLSLALVALVRRRPRVALAIIVLLVGTGATTESLKQLLATPRFSEWLGAGQIGAASWPSGHATASMTLGVCGVLAAPPPLRPLAAGLGAAFAVAVSYAILALGWHFPSDVVGGLFVAATWSLLAVAAIVAAERRRPSRARSEAPTAVPIGGPGAEGVVALALGAGLAAILGAVAVARPEQLSRFASEHTTFFVVAATIAALATALATGVARISR